VRDDAALMVVQGTNACILGLPPFYSVVRS